MLHHSAWVVRFKHVRKFPSDNTNSEVRVISRSIVISESHPKATPSSLNEHEKNMIYRMKSSRSTSKSIISSTSLPTIPPRNTLASHPNKRGYSPLRRSKTSRYSVEKLSLQPHNWKPSMRQNASETSELKNNPLTHT